MRTRTYCIPLKRPCEVSPIGAPNRAQVDNGHAYLFNRTLLENNAAPDGRGSSIYLSTTSSLQYTLPAPPGHWLIIRQGDTLQMSPGAEDTDFPYSCSAGVVGGTVPEEQLGPGCARPWYLKRTTRRCQSLILPCPAP